MDLNYFLTEKQIKNVVSTAIFVFIGLLLSGRVHSQDPISNAVKKNQGQTIEIVGKIIDKDTKIPLEFSTVTLYSIADNSILLGTISNAEGTFTLETMQSGFYIKIEFIAYEPRILYQNNLVNDNNRIDIGIIELAPNVEMMSEVEVRAEKSSVMMTLDKRIFNVGKDLTSTGGTAEDVLRNVPGISVDMDGRFNLRGNGNIRILLNGRASSLVSDENLSGLRQIRANQIEKVEVITNPSARYEAEGMAGIVNIILKKNETKGLNGSIDTHVGINNNIGLGANLNYQKDKINAFVGIGLWHANRPGSGSFRNRFYNREHPDSTIFSNMDRTHNRSTLPGFIKFGADYHPNSKNVFTTSFAYRHSNGNANSNLLYTDGLGDIENVFLVTQRLEDEMETETDILSSLIFKRLFTSKGHQLVADFQFEDKTEKEESVYEEHYYDGDNNLINNNDYLQLSNNEEGNRRLGLNIDYILPLKNDGKFEAGLQSSYREIFNNYRVREVVNSIENPDMNFTNDFLYQEFIHGVYLNVGKKIKQFSLQSGLRIEHSDVTTKLLATNEINPRKYTNLFPSAFLTYNLSDNNAFQLSYSRRIQRPTFADLNPFFNIRDRRNIFRGNPNIEPEYTDSYELGYIRYWEKGSLSSIAYYRLTKDVIKRLQRVDSDFPDVTITQAENLEFKRNYGIEFTGTYTPNQKWRINGDVNIFHSLSEGSFFHEGNEVFVGGGSFSMKAQTSSRFTIKEKLHTQLTLSYTAPRTTTQGINRATAALDFATGMDFFNKNGTLTLSVNDVFNSRRRRSFSEDETFFSEDNFLWQTRTVILSFHYRFNQQKKSNRIYSNPLNEEEDEDF